METRPSAEGGDSDAESLHASDMSSLQENFNQQQVSVRAYFMCVSVSDADNIMLQRH